VIAAQLSLKHTPELTFHYDESVDRGMRISALIDKHVEAEDRND
jgi:ribosome-binding factor A